ncbi:MAG TPA: DNA gyrase inhibitor YacG [Casimicrobiaceae bacterium]|jgi:endogenous inhibitor of DNA gyrase (YacG/DUF329 family)|nr:DNA gyrase inhibitor YacG [Casimicrobiaceae bacterium]
MSLASRARPRLGCGMPVAGGPDAAFRPFRSERGKVADLAAWASERCGVPAVDPHDQATAIDPS